MEALILIIVVGTSIWVAIDASTIGVKKGQIKGVADMGPAGWFFGCLLLWIVGFPYYLAKRGEFKRINAKGQSGQGFSSQGTGSNLNELEKLASLRDRGVLTEQEFQIQKAKILGTPSYAQPPPATPRFQSKMKTSQTSPPVVDNRTVECPHCSNSILLRNIKAGRNNCPNCREVFEAE